jgi:hypothetical protein
MHWLELLVKGPPGTSPSVVAGYWVAAFLTVAIYSFLYRDNPLYRFAESLFVGIGAAYTLALVYHNTLRPKLFLALFPPDPAVAPVWYRIIPGVLAVFMLLRFYPKLSWLSRWSLGFIVGMYSAVNITGFAQGDFVAQIHASLQPLWTGDPVSSVGAILFTIGLVATLLFFFFSYEHRGVLGVTSRIGVIFLMVGFGAGYGYTVMSRISLLIGRFQFLIESWLGLR